MYPTFLSECVECKCDSNAGRFSSIRVRPEYNAFNQYSSRYQSKFIVKFIHFLFQRSFNNVCKF